MEVVGRIDGPREVLLGALVGVPCGEVAPHRVAPAPDAVVGVRRHVLDVTRPGDRRAEVVGARLGLLRLDGGFGGVDVQVAGAGVREVHGEHRLEDGVDLLHRGFLDIPAAAPGLEQHERLAVQRSHVEVVRESLIDLGHRPRVRRVQHLAGVVVVLLLVADRHGLDQRLLHLVGMLPGQLLRLLDVLVRPWRVVAAHRSVQVGAPGPRLAPEAHGTVGVLLLSLPERTGGPQRREGVHHLDALVEELLRLGRVGGNPASEGPKGLGVVRGLFVEAGGVLHLLSDSPPGEGCRERNDDGGQEEGASAPGTFRFHA